jgi:hypothetical protein
VRRTGRSVGHALCWLGRRYGGCFPLEAQIPEGNVRYRNYLLVAEEFDRYPAPVSIHGIHDRTFIAVLQALARRHMRDSDFVRRYRCEQNGAIEFVNGDDDDEEKVSGGLV